MFRAVLKEAFELARGGKTDKYGETWNKLGLVGIYLKIFIKEGRLKNLIWDNKGEGMPDDSDEGETIRDTLLDTLCYSAYGIIAYDEGNWDGVKQSTEQLEVMREALEESVKFHQKLLEESEDNE
jgi:hypothetical protein